jgi:predicted transcriptional regulator of viral defense system
LKLGDFFAKNPVFTVEELTYFLAKHGSYSRWTRKELLAHHRKQGHILRVRRGLYIVVPSGADPANYKVDPYLLAAKMTDDAVLAYHTALEFHGKAYSIFEQFQYLARRPFRALAFRSYRFRGVFFPKKLLNKRQETFGVKMAERAGVDIHVTSLERTLVDVLDRPDLGGGWEEIWRSLESVEFFDLDQVAEYALLLENSTTVAKVGFFLEQHRETLMVDDKHLKHLREHRPRRPHYMARGSKGPGRFVADWNLVVPEAVFRRSWEEML